MSSGMVHAANHDLVLWLAAFVLVVGGGIFLGLAAHRRFGPTRQSTIIAMAGADRPAAVPSDEPVDRSLLRIVAVLSLGAGAIHLVAAPHHFDEIGDLAAGFLVSGVFQVAWAQAALNAPSRRTVVVGIVVNLAIVAAWAFSRTVGLPVGLEPWTPEAIGLPDGACTIFELLIAAGLAIRLLGLDRSALGRSRAVRSVAAIAVIPVLGLVLLTTSLATVAIASGADHGAVHQASASTAAHAANGH